MKRVKWLEKDRWYQIEQDSEGYYFIDSVGDKAYLTLEEDLYDFEDLRDEKPLDVAYRNEYLKKLIKELGFHPEDYMFIGDFVGRLAGHPRAPVMFLARDAEGKVKENIDAMYGPGFGDYD